MYTYSIYLSTSDLLSFIICNTVKYGFSSIWKWHSDHLGKFYESSLGCMPTEYFRKQQQQPP